jgi:hypothetical protein
MAKSAMLGAVQLPEILALIVSESYSSLGPDDVPGGP